MIIVTGTRAAAGGSIDLSSATASRTTGVAPLYVFFDASSITSSLTTRPFHDVELRWGFGETTGPGVGTWSYGSRSGSSSRNIAYGPLAAHVFETPGTYTVTVSDSSGAATKTFNITVDDPNTTFATTKTVCFSTSGNFTGAPSGATQVTTSDLATALGYATSGNTVRRLLFRAGETFIAASPCNLSVTGPGIIGSFGSGSRPVLKAGSGTFVADDIILSLSGSTTPTLTDWRIMDVIFDGTNYPSTRIVGHGLTGGIDQVTSLRAGTLNIGISFIASDDILNFWNNNGHPGHHVWDQLGVIDMDVTTPTLGVVGYGSYLAGERVFYAGVNIDGSGNMSHNSRFTYLGKAVLSNNSMFNPGATEHSFKIHGPTVFGGSGVTQSGIGAGYTRWVVISDNRVKSTTNAYQIAIASQNGASDERLKDIILERNWHDFGSGTTVGQYIAASEVTSRNNIINMNGGADHIGVYFTQRATQIPDQVRCYNNTVYTSDTLSGGFVGFQADGVVTNASAKNNLCYAPNDSSGAVTSGTWTTSNNSANIHINPSFVGPTTALSGWAVNSGSYSILAGALSVPVYSDVIMTNRPAGLTPDIGAYKF